jgi:alkylation response protein AidB-like acyl-CoA dehydrogenase
MDFSLSEDNLLLRQSARTFLEKEMSLARLQVPGASVADAGYEANWSKITSMGWQGLVIDEAYGGLGLSCIDLAIILGEMSRTLAPSPFLGTLFGSWALQCGGSPEQKSLVTPAVAAGRTRLALAIAESSGAVDGSCREATARRQGGGVPADRRQVLRDRRCRGRLVVVAAHDEETGRRAFFLVDASQDDVQSGPLPSRDVTRQVCDVRLKDAVGERLAADDEALWPWLRDRILFSLAAESAAGAQMVMEMTTDYAKERVPVSPDPALD